MAIFQSIQKYMAVLGIDRLRSTVRHGFNERNVLVAGLLGTGCISSFLYLLEEPSFKENIISVYATADSIACCTDFVLLIWKSPKVFQYIQSLEDIIEMSRQVDLVWI